MLADVLGEGEGDRGGQPGHASHAEGERRRRDGAGSVSHHVAAAPPMARMRSSHDQITQIMTGSGTTAGKPKAGRVTSGTAVTARPCVRTMRKELAIR